MFDYPLDFRYGRRLVNIDYECLGVKKIWYYRNTIILLTSFDMETKGYFDRPDNEYCYSRAYNKYSTLIYDFIINNPEKFHDGIPDDRRDPSLTDGYAPFDIDNACFYKEAFLNYIADSDTLYLDIDLLKKYLRGKEAPRIPIFNRFDTDHTDDENSSTILEPTENQVATSSDKDGSSPTDKLPSCESQYCFEKTAQSWNIKFGDIELIGVKDLAGMDYIATLLKNPGAPIGVIQIQAMLNPLSMNLSDGNQSGDFEDQDAPPAVINVKSARSSKSISLEKLKNRLLELSQERNTLDPDCDHIELESIDNEYAKIEAEIDNILYSKNDDPEIKKNRDKVSKAIKAAIDNISGLKTKEGYASTPISNFLTQHIKTASECIYSPPTINPPEWSF